MIGLSKVVNMIKKKEQRLRVLYTSNIDNEIINKTHFGEMEAEEITKIEKMKRSLFEKLKKSKMIPDEVRLTNAKERMKKLKEQPTIDEKIFEDDAYLKGDLAAEQYMKYRYATQLIYILQNIKIDEPRIKKKYSRDEQRGFIRAAAGDSCAELKRKVDKMVLKAYGRPLRDLKNGGSSGDRSRRSDEMIEDDEENQNREGSPGQTGVRVDGMAKTDNNWNVRRTKRGFSEHLGSSRQDPTPRFDDRSPVSLISNIKKSSGFGFIEAYIENKKRSPRNGDGSDPSGGSGSPYNLSQKRGFVQRGGYLQFNSSTTNPSRGKGVALGGLQDMIRTNSHTKMQVWDLGKPGDVVSVERRLDNIVSVKKYPHKGKKPWRTTRGGAGSLKKTKKNEVFVMNRMFGDRSRSSQGSFKPHQPKSNSPKRRVNSPRRMIKSKLMSETQKKGGRKAKIVLKNRSSPSHHGHKRERFHDNSGLQKSSGASGTQDFLKISKISKLTKISKIMKKSRSSSQLKQQTIRKGSTPQFYLTKGLKMAKKRILKNSPRSEISQALKKTQSRKTSDNNNNQKTMTNQSKTLKPMNNFLRRGSQNNVPARNPPPKKRTTICFKEAELLDVKKQESKFSFPLNFKKIKNLSSTSQAKLVRLFNPSIKGGGDKKNGGLEDKNKPKKVSKHPDPKRAPQQGPQQVKVSSGKRHRSSEKSSVKRSRGGFVVRRGVYSGSRDKLMKKIFDR